jgi:hypothetical protein
VNRIRRLRDAARIRHPEQGALLSSTKLILPKTSGKHKSPTSIMKKTTSLLILAGVGLAGICFAPRIAVACTHTKTQGPTTVISGCTWPACTGNAVKRTFSATSSCFGGGPGLTDCAAIQVGQTTSTSTASCFKTGGVNCGQAPWSVPAVATAMVNADVATGKICPATPTPHQE